MDKKHIFLGEILLKKGLINQIKLDEALKEQERTKEFLGEILIKRGYIRQEDLLHALSEQFDIPAVTLKDRYIDWKFASKFSSCLIFDYRCIPIAMDEISITFAISNPLDVFAVKKAEQETLVLTRRLKLALATASDIAGALMRYTQYIIGNIYKRFE